jgi:hypothetical protein
MDGYSSVEDGIDWLTGEYTYKKKRLRRALRRLEGETMR